MGTNSGVSDATIKSTSMMKSAGAGRWTLPTASMSSGIDCGTTHDRSGQCTRKPDGGKIINRMASAAWTGDFGFDDGRMV
jgi:hypothetical protein